MTTLPKYSPPTRTLKRYEALNIFERGYFKESVRINDGNPAIGELWSDINDDVFLAPLKDDRGGNDISVPLFGLKSSDVWRFALEEVRIAGVYDPEVGLIIERITYRDQRFKKPQTRKSKAKGAKA